MFTKLKSQMLRGNVLPCFGKANKKNRGKWKIGVVDKLANTWKRWNRESGDTSGRKELSQMIYSVLQYISNGATLCHENIQEHAKLKQEARLSKAKRRAAVDASVHGHSVNTGD